MLGIIGFALFYPVLRFYDHAHAPRHTGMTAESVGSVEHLGQVLFREYLLPFEATSILILVAIIGVVVLAKRQRQS